MFGESAERMLRTSVYVDLAALESNYRTIEGAVAPGVFLLCIIKADAYGHGAVEVGRRLESIGARYFGVATVEEGRVLREKGISIPILVLSGVMPWDDLQPLVDYDLTPVVVTAEMLERIAGFRGGSRVKIHVKVDTGMGRLGLSYGEVDALARRLAGLRHVEVEGVMSHFASSERRDEYGFKQIEDFRGVLDVFRSHGLEPKFVHMANSGAVCNYPEAHFNMVRPGIVLYGSYPDVTLQERLYLKPVMRWDSRVAHVRLIPAGVSLSYGRTYVTPRSRRIAYIPIGYADGYPTGLSNKGEVLIRGKRCAVVGRVCMEWILADVTDLPEIGPNEEVTLLGSGATGEVIAADEIAARAGTIPYEILCGVSRRVPRRYA
jgi:alanine racemase